METFWNVESMKHVHESLMAWLVEYVFDISSFFQAVSTLLTFVLAYFLMKTLKKFFREAFISRIEQRQVRDAISILLLPMGWLLFQWILVIICQEIGWATHITRTVASLLTAWVVIRLLSGFVREPLLAKSMAIIIWTLAALDIVNLLQPATVILDKLAFPIGELRISLLMIIKAVVTLLFLLWLAISLSSMLERRIQRVAHFEPSLRVLFSKFIKVTFVVLATFIGLASVGIDMSAFAVFGGAIGVGIGFGLQKVVSNLICGVILLLDRSIKPGDVIALDKGQTFGWVNKLSGRCVSVRTRSGEEHLIPNEDIITQRMENWSYTDNNLRLKLPVGVSYDSDVPKAMALLEEAVQGAERVLSNPKPGVRLLGFGDNAVNLELRVWIRDPELGINNVKTQLYLKIWELFREGGIRIPFPQRDIHLRSSELSQFK